jgi:hypothetical protein
MTRRRFDGGDRVAFLGDGYQEVIMATLISIRRSTFGINCIRGSDELIAPEKSEYCEGTHIRHLWLCRKCAAYFESIKQNPVEAMTMDDILLSRVVGEREGERTLHVSSIFSCP